MSNELINVTDTIKTLGLPVEYNNMLSIIQDSEKEISVATSQHGKSHSQFQYAMLDCAGPIGGPTKIRNWRQILAVIDSTRNALEEAYFNIKKETVREKILREKAETLTGYEAELVLVEADEISSRLIRIKSNMAGAIRKLATYTLHFKELEKQIREELNKNENEPITEEDFEKDEERFHIMKVFEQGLIAARSSGRIDHGNMIYFHDVGINGKLAQEDIQEYLKLEQRFRELNPRAMPHEIFALEHSFLDNMAKKYAGCSIEYAKIKGLQPGILLDVTLKISQ